MTRARIAGLLLVCLLHVPAAWASNCAGTSVGFTPLTDLGAGLYHGFPGGLYGVGMNTRPAGHNAAGIAIANSIVPLDTLGNPDPSGSIVVISIGMSNTTQEWQAFIPKAVAEPLRNPKVRVIDCALGGQSADRIDTPTAAYWDSVVTRLRGHRSSPLQAQVVWLKEADAQPRGGFPASADTLRWNEGTVVRILEQKLPSVRIAYLSSRIYAGYATSTLNPEPYAYESGFAVKGLIDGQISGADSLNYDSGSGPVQAPWLSWGPYLWADGLTPRSDGLTWQCGDFVTSDGTHPSTTGRDKVATMLLAFFKSDETATPWFLAHTAATPDPEIAEPALRFAPNPARGSLAITFVPDPGERWSLEILDTAGRRVALLGRGQGDGIPRYTRWRARESVPTVHPGVFWVRFVTGGRVIANPFVLLEVR